MRVPRRSDGFTLIEALVAMSIFSFIGVAAYQLLASTGNLKKGGEARFEAVSGLQVAMRLLDEDFSQFSPRPIPRGEKDKAPALDGAPDEAVVELTRSGWRNPMGAPRSRLQRVAWLIDEDEQLVRRFRRVIDSSDPDDSVERVVVSGIEEFELRYLDEKGKWVDEWPPEVRAPPAPAGEQAAPDPLPVAVEVRLVQAQIGEVTRVIPLR